MSRSNYVCIPCRHTAKLRSLSTPLCPTCRVEMIDAGSKWRPPKKNNDKAWLSMAPAVHIPGEIVAGLYWLTFYPGRYELMQWEGMSHARFCRCTDCKPVKSNKKERSAIPQFNRYGMNRSVRK